MEGLSDNYPGVPVKPATVQMYPLGLEQVLSASLYETKAPVSIYGDIGPLRHEVTPMVGL